MARHWRKLGKYRWGAIAITTFCLLLLGQPLAAAQSPGSPPTPDTTLQVGVSPNPPLAIKSGSDWDGIAVHLWRELAYELDLDYEWREVSPSQAIAQIESGNLDLAIVAATAPREQQVDFTQSYFATTLGIATQRRQRFLEVVKAVLSPQFLRICLGLSLIFVVIGVLIWAFERSANKDMYHPHPVKGIWDGFWWAGVTMTTIGYGDKTPKTVAGRILGLLWMLVAMGLTASLTASITSVLVLDQGLQPLQVQQLQQQQVGSVANTPIARYLEQESVSFQSFSTPREGLQAVETGQIEAFVYSAVPLRSLNRNTFQRQLQVEDTGIQVSHYTFALAENSPLQEPLNRQILQEISEPDWQQTLNRYLPQSD